MRPGIKIVISIIFIASALCSTGCSLFEKKRTIEIPNTRWPEIYLRSIDTATNSGSLTKLREISLPIDDIEIRIWRGFSLYPLEGVILSRTNGVWSAKYIISDDCCERKSADVNDLPPPSTGWESFVSRMENSEIYTIADGVIACGEQTRNEGMSYVTEINVGGNYRIYRHPAAGPVCPESQKVKMIGRIIAEEFYDGKSDCVNAIWFACVTKYGVQNDL